MTQMLEAFNLNCSTSRFQQGRCGRLKTYLKTSEGRYKLRYEKSHPTDFLHDAHGVSVTQMCRLAPDRKKTESCDALFADNRHGVVLMHSGCIDASLMHRPRQGLYPLDPKGGVAPFETSFTSANECLPILVNKQDCEATVGLQKSEPMDFLNIPWCLKRRKDNSVYLDMKTNSHHLLPPYDLRQPTPPQASLRRVLPLNRCSMFLCSMVDLHIEETKADGGDGDGNGEENDLMDLMKMHQGRKDQSSSNSSFCGSGGIYRHFAEANWQPLMAASKNATSTSSIRIVFFAVCLFIGVYISTRVFDVTMHHSPSLLAVCYKRSVKDVPTLDEGCLHFSDDRTDDPSDPIRQAFGQDFVDTPNKAYRPEFLKREGVLDLGKEGNEGGITPPRETAKVFEVFNKSHNVVFHKVPKLFDKVKIEPIRPGSLIAPAAPNSLFDLANTEGSF
ncbi:hypothetical protein LXL04_035259 [Taraxacum kok-saghyz]